MGPPSTKSQVQKFFDLMPEAIKFPNRTPRQRYQPPGTTLNKLAQAANTLIAPSIAPAIRQYNTMVSSRVQSPLFISGSPPFHQVPPFHWSHRTVPPFHREVWLSPSFNSNGKRSWKLKSIIYILSCQWKTKISGQRNFLPFNYSRAKLVCSWPNTERKELTEEW